MECAGNVEVRATTRFPMVDVAFHAGCRRSCTVALSQRKAGTGTAATGSKHPPRRHQAAEPREQRLGISPGAAVSRRARSRQRGRCGDAAHAGGGGRPNMSGTTGSAARNIVANRMGRSRLRWLVVESGQKVAKKPGEPLRGRCDSFVVETDVHYPTDVSLLWDAVRCLLRETGRAAEQSRAGRRGVVCGRTACAPGDRVGHQWVGASGDSTAFAAMVRTASRVRLPCRCWRPTCIASG